MLPLLDGLFGVILTEEINMLVFVTSGDQLLELQFLEIVGEVMKEITHSWVVAIAIDDFALKMLTVMLEFPLNI
jgi:hypothetical protein